MTTAFNIVRSGQPVEGAATRLTANLLEWQPGGGVGGLVPGGSYTISGVHLTDLQGNPATASATFTHLTTSDQMLLLAYAAPTDTQPDAQSAYGLTTLFQGRTWHGDLGGYYYRNRWYLPEAGVFAERDPAGYADSANPISFLRWNTENGLDPMGEKLVFLWYGRGSDYGEGEGFDQLASELAGLAKADGVSYRLTVVNRSGVSYINSESEAFTNTRDDYEVYALSGASNDYLPVMKTALHELVFHPIEPIILIGHSLGAARQMQLAAKAEGWGVTVDLLVAVDLHGFLLPTSKTVPGNVRSFLAFYSNPTEEQRERSGGIEPVGARSFHVGRNTKLLGVIPIQEVHTRMDSHPTVHQRILKEIALIR